MWRSVCASSIGASHREERLPCEDEGALRLLPEDTLIGAVSDGAGSAKHASQGAILTTTAAVAYLTNTVSQMASADKEQVNDLFLETVYSIERILVQAAETLGYNKEDLACTLLAIVATPKRVAAMQIGDGFMVTRWKDEEDFALLFEPEHGEYVNETRFVTDPEVANHMKSGLWEKSPGSVWMSTDGLERLAIDCRAWKPFHPFFAFFEEELSKPHREEELEFNLKTFLDSPDVNRRTQDDKTLLMSLFTEGPGDETS